MKRILLLSLFLLTLMSAFIGCAKEEIPSEKDNVKTDCMHVFGDWKTTKESSCTADGERIRVCSECFVIEKGAIPALGHTEVIDLGTKPTCTEGGISDGKHCSVCSEILVEQIPLDACGHTEVETSDCKAVLDGEIDLFLAASLADKVGNSANA